MDSPTKRMIKIGKASIGLIGLDIALNRAMAEEMEPDQAVDFVFQTVKESNYIPSGMESRYQQALRKEYEKLLGISHEEDDSLVIRIFGSGCISCNSINKLVIDAMGRAKVAADIEQIHDPDEIGRAGITATPALMINGVVKISGFQPNLAQVERWVREAME